MRPVFANSAWVSSPERLILRNGGWRRRRLRVRYGLFIHPKVGPVLIDTGYTHHALSAPDRGSWLRFYGRMLSPQLVVQEQAEPFLSRFGLTLRDISVVIVTHFHADHVSGLMAFPHARFISCGLAWANLKQSGAFQNIRHGIFTELIPDDFGERLVPIETMPVQDIPDLG